MNAGCFSKSISEYVVYVTTNKGVYNNNCCQFDYRSSIFDKKAGEIISSVALMLKPSETDIIESKKEKFQACKGTFQCPCRLKTVHAQSKKRLPLATCEPPSRASWRSLNGLFPGTLSYSLEIPLVAVSFFSFLRKRNGEGRGSGRFPLRDKARLLGSSREKL